MRRLRFLGVSSLLAFLALAFVAGNNPAWRARAQASIAAQISSPASTTARSAGNAVPAIVATNVEVRALAVSPRSADPSAQLLTSTAAPVQLFLASGAQPNRLSSFALPTTRAASATTAPVSASNLAVIAGTGVAGSLGDGGEATAAQFNFNLAGLSNRSGITVASDGTIYVADTNNATIRAIAGPSSSEPGIVRSVAGRWAPSQNVELSEPLGIALDRAGNLYIADHAANSIDILYGAMSAKSGTLESFASFNAPSSVAVSPDGRTVFVASSDSGAIVAVNTKTHAVRDAGVIAGPQFPAALLSATSARAVPQGLATDGAGNLFISYAIWNSSEAADSSATQDTTSFAPTGEILRLDAFTAKTTTAARGLANPGEIGFDANGDLFVSSQGTNQILKFSALGVPATGVSLTPPCSLLNPPCFPGTVTDFGDVPVGGSTDSTALQSFQFTNNTSVALTSVASSFSGGNANDFTVQNSSCTSTLAANASCNFNVAFTPTANATTGCQDPPSGAQRCANLSVTYAGATSPLLAPVTGLADDFQIVCVSTTSVICVPSAAGGTVQITIQAGYSATYQFAIMPDANFSGPVTLRCPTDLPASPAGTTGQPTTCGISAGTSVTEPLISSLVIDVTAGTPAPFNVTFQTTNGAGAQFPPSTGTGSSEKRTLVLAASSAANNRPGPAAHSATHASSALSRFSMSTLVVLVSALVLAISFLAFQFFVGTGRKRALKPAIALVALLLGVTLFAGCHHTTKITITSTPAGTYQLTVNGAAQNTSRGFTMTLIVQ